MTYNYSVSYRTALYYYLTGCYEQGGKISNELKEKLIDNFTKVFDFLKNSYETDLFYKKRSKDVAHLLTKIVLRDNSIIFLQYYKTKHYRLEVTSKVDEIRTSMSLMRPQSQNVDIVQTTRAALANTVHAMDAEFARTLLRKQPMLVIHDAFGTTPQSCCYFIDELNLVYKECASNTFNTNSREWVALYRSYNMFIVL